MNLTERFRYRCPACAMETITGDELRGQGDLSELAERLVAYAGSAVGGMFDQAARTLSRMPGFDVSPKTIQSVCLRRGERVKAAEARMVSAPHEIRPESRPERLVTGVDGVLIGRVDPAHRRRASKSGKVPGLQSGSGGAGRKQPGKGKLANFWKEVKTCVIYAIDSAGKAVGPKAYCATQAAHDVFGYRVAAEAVQAGAELAKEVIFIGDGAKWPTSRSSEEVRPCRGVGALQAAEGQAPSEVRPALTGVGVRALRLEPVGSFGACQPTPAHTRLPGRLGGAKRRTVLIEVLDWYHAVEHLWEVARAHFGEASDMVTPWPKVRSLRGSA